MKNLIIRQNKLISIIKQPRRFTLGDFSWGARGSFYICYNVIVKTAMAVCAKNNLRVKSRAGHHTELISKLAEYLEDPELRILP